MTVEDTSRPDTALSVPDPGPGHVSGMRPAEAKLAGIAHLRDLADAVATTQIIGPRGQTMSVEAAKEWGDAIASDIACAEASGSLRHRTVPRILRISTFVLVAVVDFPIMLWLAASVFNVDWLAPWGIELAISTVVAALATAGSAAALHHIGHELREHKTDRRRLDRSDLPLGMRLGLVAVVLLVGTMAAVMFMRVYTEGLLSGLDGLAVLLAALVALVMLVTSALLCRTSFRDGSPERDDLAHFSAAVAPHLQRRLEYRRRAVVLAREYDALDRRGST